MEHEGTECQKHDQNDDYDYDEVQPSHGRRFRKTKVGVSRGSNVLQCFVVDIGKGIDVKRLTYDLMVCLKDAIVYRSTSDESILERINAEHAKAILRYYSTDNALKVTEILNEASKSGVSKINVDTDLRLAMTGAIRKTFAENAISFEKCAVFFEMFLGALPFIF